MLPTPCIHLLHLYPLYLSLSLQYPQLMFISQTLQCTPLA